MSEKSFFSRLADLKADLATQQLKKSGYNNHLKYNYFQLSDFEPVLASLGAKYGIFHYFSFPVEHVELHVCDAFSDKEIVTCCMLRTHLARISTIFRMREQFRHIAEDIF